MSPDVTVAICSSLPTYDDDGDKGREEEAARRGQKLLFRARTLWLLCSLFLLRIVRVVVCSSSTLLLSLLPPFTPLSLWSWCCCCCCCVWEWRRTDRNRFRRSDNNKCRLPPALLVRTKLLLPVALLLSRLTAVSVPPSSSSSSSCNKPDISSAWSSSRGGGFDDETAPPATTTPLECFCKSITLLFGFVLLRKASGEAVAFVWCRLAAPADTRWLFVTSGSCCLPSRRRLLRCKSSQCK